MKLLRIMVGAAVLLSLSHCSTTRVVRPLSEGETQIGASVGGPVVGFKNGSAVSSSLFIPFISLQGAYGVSDKLSLYGAWDVTPIFVRTLHLDLGATYGLRNAGVGEWGLSGSGGLQSFVSLRDGTTRILPDLALNLYRPISERAFWYVNSGHTFDLWSGSSPAVATGFWRPYVGLGFALSGEKVHQQFEAKLIGFNEYGQDAIIGHFGVLGHGQWALYYSINLKR